MQFPTMGGNTFSLSTLNLMIPADLTLKVLASFGCIGLEVTKHKVEKESEKSPTKKPSNI